jgi:hypothetical protein
MDIHGHAAAVALDMACVVQSCAGFQEERGIPVTVTGNEITQPVFIPIADRDCRALASGERKGDNRIIRLQIHRVGKHRSGIRANILVEEDMTVHELPDKQVLIIITVPVVHVGRAEKFNPQGISVRKQKFGFNK